MKVLISDKIAENTLEILKANGIDFKYAPELTPYELTTDIPQYEGLVVRSRTKVTAEIIGRTVKLKVIGRVGSGVDNIDMETAKMKKITVVNAPDANSGAVAEFTIALILSLLRKIPKAISSMKEGLWLKKELGGSELSGKTVGIVGYGHIGKKVESLVRAFGAHPIIFSRSFKTATLEELFSKSDIITLHTALTPETKGMIKEKLLNLMKPAAFFINASRGEIVDEEVLYKILSEKKITGAALDVYSQEPLPVDSRFRKLDNVILTPHIGGATRQALEKASISVVEDLVRVLQGKVAIYQVRNF